MLKGVLTDFSNDISNLCFNPQFDSIKEKYFKETLQWRLESLIKFLSAKEFLIGYITI
jgi:hypothetical protein